MEHKWNTVKASLDNCARFVAQASTMVTIPKKSRLDEDLKIRLDADLKARLQAISKETGQKLSAVARFLMIAGLEQHEREAKAKK